MRVFVSPRSFLCVKDKKLVGVGELAYVDDEKRSLCQKCALEEIREPKLNQK